ncbi:MAG: Oxygen-independent coproporphyrinogen-III oxidase 1 [Pelotomaculum sp. PtaB.Bin104]|nr:MAG: Oxygen-independent coproporphyrinogen-III oxidase 1 [Pelotomaculum sp. PtaB.Bin104]
MLSTLLRVLVAGRLKPFRLNANEIPRFDPHLEKFGLYAHIPFCRRICPFCPYNKMLYREDKAEEYCKALLVELRRYKEKFSAARIDSVYFGGGTPTSVTPRLVQLIDEIRGGDVAFFRPGNFRR